MSFFLKRGSTSPDMQALKDKILRLEGELEDTIAEKISLGQALQSAYKQISDSQNTQDSADTKLENDIEVICEKLKSLVSFSSAKTPFEIIQVIADELAAKVGKI